MSWRDSTMRVLMTADTVGGVWTYALDLCRALEPHGVKVALATMGRMPSAAQYREVGALANVELFPSAFKLEWMEDPWASAEAAGDWLLAVYAKVHPDLVHLNNFAHGALPWGAPTLMVGHSCVFSWWRAVHGERPPAAWDRYFREVRASLHAAKQVVAPTAAMLRELQRIYGCEGVVIPNGSSAETTDCPKDHVILSAGRLWDKAKNVALLGEVSKNCAWPILVAGECDGEIPGNVKCLGPQARDRMPELFAGTAIYAAPAKYEPFGLAILEAARASCALVLGDIPSLRENWEGAAIFADTTDSDAWTRELNALANDPCRRQSLGAAARERSQRFTTGRMAAKYFELYSSLVGARELTA